MIEYVLHRPAQEERAAIDEAIARALDVLPLVLAGAMQDAMLKLHTRDAEQKETAAVAKADRTLQPPRGERPEPAAEKPAQEREAAAAARTTAPEIAAGAAAVGPQEPPAREPAPGAGGGETARKSGLDALLRKFIPGGGADRKK